VRRDAAELFTSDRWTSSPLEEIPMNEDRIAGTVKNVGGKEEKDLDA
jgi:hypothetical protein